MKQLFAQITKVDEKARTVSGRMVQEVPDKSGEIFDYDSSKPYFKTWVEETSAASGGKSLGNVRAMHGPVAAGKIVGIDFNDTEKAMDITAKIVDDQEWRKVMEGVYTGFSIGGNYVGNPVVEGDLKRYTASPSEASLVDNPCIPTALFFDVHKADGSVLQKAFKPKEGEASGGTDTSGEDKNAEDAEARGVGEGKKEEEPDGDEGKETPPGGDEDKNGAGDMEDDEGKKAPPPKKAAGPVEYEVEGSEADLGALHKAMTENHLNVPDVTDLVTKVFAKDWGALFGLTASKATFADPTNKRFPLETGAQVKAALYYVNQDAAKALYTEEEYAVVKAAVETAWKEKVSDTVPDDVTKAVGEQDLAKSFYLSSQFLGVLDSLQYLVSSAQYTYLNGSTPQLAVKCKMAMQDLANCVADMVSTDVADLSRAKEDNEAVTVLRARLSDLQKATVVDKDTIEKIGARNSTKDSQRIQSIHDLAVELGAKSPKVNPNGTLEDKVAPEGDLNKMVASEVQKAVAPLLEQINLLKAQPAAPRAVLRAVAKAQDLGTDNPGAGTQIEPVRKNSGEVDEVATDIKSVHKSGGRPLFTR